MTATDGRGAVRRRNAEAILDAAADVLSADPGAGMAAIAARAGVGRATLYRHYPAREDLLRALQDRVRGTFHRLVLELAASHAPPAVALERFVAALVDLREGAAVLAPARSEARLRAVWQPVLGWVRQQQAAGTLDPELDPVWVLAALRGQLRAAALELDAGTLRRADAPGLVARSFLRGAGA